MTIHVGRMLRLAAFEPFDPLIQIERAFQSIHLCQNLVVTSCSDILDSGKTASYGVKPGVHFFFNRIETGIDRYQKRACHLFFSR